SGVPIEPVDVENLAATGVCLPTLDRKSALVKCVMSFVTYNPKSPTNKRKRENTPSVVTSDKRVEYFELKEKEKKKTEQRRKELDVKKGCGVSPELTIFCKLSPLTTEIIDSSICPNE
ncbi:hypothetical protein C0J52_24234, partial [Blattella germanica]